MCIVENNFSNEFRGSWIYIIRSNFNSFRNQWMVARMYELSKCSVPVVDDIMEAFDEKRQIFSAERLKGLGGIVVKVFL
jgi:hypothetical protein